MKRYIKNSNSYDKYTQYERSGKYDQYQLEEIKKGLDYGVNVN